jgi:hypothetical protein
MKSISYLEDLEKLPNNSDYSDFGIEEIIGKSHDMSSDFFSIEVAAGTEEVFSTLFDQRNIPDSLQEAYSLSMTDKSSVMSLYQNYLEKQELGQESVNGLISNIKGKIFELNIESKLENEYPGFDFEIAKNPNQPIWDLKGINSNGEEILVQAKMGGENYASDVLERMNEDPNVLFSVSKEIKERILESNPELADRLVTSNLKSSEFTEDVKSQLEALAQNEGIDIPDEIGDILPYVTEIVLGIRLLVDIVKVERDFSKIQLDDRSRIHALKALILFSRFGISITLTTVGGLAGTAINPGIGTGLGAISGAILSGYLNKKLKPHILEIAEKLTKVDDNEMFYLKNKSFIDSLGKSFYLIAQGI